MSKENVYDKWHFVFRPKCGLRGIHTQRIINFLSSKHTNASYILSYEDAQTAEQCRHFDLVIRFPTPKRKSNFIGNRGRGLIKAVFHDHIASNYSKGIFGRPAKDLNEWDHMVGYCQKEHRILSSTCMDPKLWMPSDYEEKRTPDQYCRDCLEDFQRNELKLLKEKKYIGRIVLHKKDWEVYMMDWLDRNPKKFETPIDVVEDMLKTGRYVFGFLDQKSRWTLFEHYFYGMVPNTAELSLMMSNDYHYNNSERKINYIK